MNYDQICMGCMEYKGDAVECPSCGWVDQGMPESPQHLKPGTLLHEKYLVGRALGQGGFGITYLGWDINLKLKLAIKEYMPQDLASRSEGNTRVSVYTSRGHREQYEYGLEKFLQEAQTLAQFDGHPNIVSVRDFFRDNDTAYIVMSYVEGITLKEYLAQAGNQVEEDKAMAIIMPVLDALAEVHAVNILHRDISTDNIFINKRGQVILIDFGAARQAVSEKGRSMSIILKPGYTPEEQYRSKGVQGPWTDIYAVAVTFYRMITGKMPPESLDRLAEDTLLLPSQLGIAIGEAREQALQKALAIRAEDRFQDVREFQQALLAAGPDATTAPSGAGAGAAAPSPPPPKPAPAAVAAAPIAEAGSPVKSRAQKALRVAVIVAAGFGVLFMVLVIAAIFSNDNESTSGSDEKITAGIGTGTGVEAIISVPADYGTIQEAIDAAESGEVIVVAEGTYYENIDFRGKDIVLRSSNPDDPGVVSRTIIDGGGNGPVITARSGESEAAKVIGLHITGGYGMLETVETEFEGEITPVSEYVGGGILVMGGTALTIEKNLISGNDYIDLEKEDDVNGGGIVIFGDSSAQITANTISGNKSNTGGGILVIYNSEAVIRDNKITEISSPMNPDREFSAGGIFLVYNSSATIENNVISDNTAPYMAGGIYLFGGSNATIRNNEIHNSKADYYTSGIFVFEKSTTTIENNRIGDNTAGELCAGISIGIESSATIRDNVIENNNSDVGLGLFIAENSTATLTGNTIRANRADSYGGGMYLMDNSSAIVSNNTFINNYAVEGGGGILLLERSTLTLSNNVFEDNRSDGIGGAILADRGSKLELDDPDSNTYINNKPKDIAIE